MTRANTMGAFSHKPSTWQPPLELQRSTPREVELTAAGWAVSVVAVGLVAGAIVMFTLLFQIASQDATRWAGMQAEATSVQGEVIGLRRTGSGDNMRYRVDYEFRTGERTVSGSSTVRRERWRGLQKGAAIEVVYARSQPEQNWLRGAEPKGMPMAVAIFGPVALLVPAPLIAWQLRRQRRLLEEGRAALATVVAVKKFKSQHGNHSSVEYQFQTLAGTRRTGKYNAQRKAPEVGEELVVVYHPDEEKWSAKYPLSLVRVRSND